MLDDIVGIVLNKFLQPRTRKQKADDKVKETLVFLHECLIVCHDAYLEYVAGLDDMSLANWRKAVSDLATVLDEVGLALAAFSQETFNFSAAYFISETKMSDGKNIYDLRENEYLDQMIRKAKLLQSSEPEGGVDNDFVVGTSMLREFMKGHMTLGEIQQAQEAFGGNKY